jgi:peptidoglycan/xylan/chitin deacetylase (PgdA/CDA1 family)
VAGIVHVLQRSGAHATLFPNGRFNASWGPVAGAVKDLIKRGQLVVGNHTFTHTDPRRESADAFAKDLQRNERWIERTFGVTGRPWFRPPYGSYDHATIDAAGPLGYTRVILWSGTLADSDRRSVPYLLRAVRYWARPGVIMLMHGNYPNTARALPRILRLLALARLRPVTVAELLRGR